MSEQGVALEGATVVVRGQFNPAIVSPSWLQDQGLVGSVEMNDVQIEVITRDISVFRVGWLTCNVSAEVLQVSTVDPEEFVRLKDVAGGVLRLLSHTPVSGLGINREYHFVVSSLAEWHAIGDTLVPKDIWVDVLDSPGMRSATLWGIRPDVYGGHVQVQVEPSVRVPRAVYVAVNDHFDLTVPDRDKPSRDVAWEFNDEAADSTAKKIPIALEILSREWGASFERAEQARKKIASLSGGTA